MEGRSKTCSTQLSKQFLFSFATLLVTEGTAFYNPSNTALGAVVSFTHTPVLDRQAKTVAFSASERLNIDFQYGNSQEH